MDEGLVASSINSLISVVRFSGDVSSLNVLEGVVHKTTIATMVVISGRASNQLLFGEIDGLGGLISDDQSRFQSTGGGESPT